MKIMRLLKFKTFREAKLISYVLSYAHNIEVTVRRHQDGWWHVVVNQFSSEYVHPSDYFNSFRSHINSSKQKPFWWSIDVLNEISEFGSRLCEEKENDFDFYCGPVSGSADYSYEEIYGPEEPYEYQDERPVQELDSWANFVSQGGIRRD